MRFFEYMLFLVIGMFLGAFLYKTWFVDTGFVRPAVVHHTTVLEQIEQVAKLITLEGQYQDIQNYEKTKWYPFSSKKAIVRYKGKVSVGFDLSEMKFNLDTVNRVIYVESMPKAQVLSVDARAEYLNKEESLFNSFTAEELSSIADIARQNVERLAVEGGLLLKAEAAGLEHFALMRALAEQGGWRLELGKPRLGVDSLGGEVQQPKRIDWADTSSTKFVPR